MGLSALFKSGRSLKRWEENDMKKKTGGDCVMCGSNAECGSLRDERDSRCGENWVRRDTFRGECTCGTVPEKRD